MRIHVTMATIAALTSVSLSQDGVQAENGWRSLALVGEGKAAAGWTAFGKSRQKPPGPRPESRKCIGSWPMMVLQFRHWRVTDG